MSYKGREGGKEGESEREEEGKKVEKVLGFAFLLRHWCEQRLGRASDSAAEQ